MRYLVIGVYDDNGQRFADTVEAENPAVAEEIVLKENKMLVIAGVVAVPPGADGLEVVA